MGVLYPSVLFLLTLLLSEATSQPLPTREPFTCNETVNSLREMLERAEDMNVIDSHYVMCVDLTEPEYLNYTTTQVRFSVVIKSLNRTQISCTNAKILPLTDYKQFPLIFNTSALVVIENVDFNECMRPVQLIWTTRVELVNSTFSNFKPGGAVEVSNSPFVLVKDCLFTNNTSEGIGTTQYSGNSGGIAFGFDDTFRPNYIKHLIPEIVIIGTMFINNEATAEGEYLRDVSFVLSQKLYNQRGGAVAVYIGTPDYDAQVVIKDCVLEKNKARDSGGAVYMNLGGPNNSHSIWILETEFVENNGPDGGGLEITQYSDSDYDRPNRLILTNCQFLRNIARFGGGFKSIQIGAYLDVVSLVNCTFIGNTAQVGSALYLQSVYSVPGITILERSTLRDCTFQDNVGNRGTLFVILNSVGIRGETNFKGNTGPALRILNSLVSLGGNISFIENKPHSEGFSGALYFSQYGQVILKRNVNILFLNNTGNDEGASIVVKGQVISAGFPQQLYNPQCFLQYEDPTKPTQQWEVSMLFEGNRAQVGPVVYTSDLDPCQWYSKEQPFFSKDSSIVWGFMKMRDNYIVRDDEEFVLPDYYVQTGIHSLQIANDTDVIAPPGSTIEVDVVALDQRNKNTSAFLELLRDPNNENDNITFEPNIVQTAAGVGKISFTYMSSDLTGNSSVTLKASFSTEEVEDNTLTLTHELCLPGYTLVGNTCECTEGTDSVLFCDPNKKGILLADGLWGAPPTWSRTLVTHTCPSGYCDCSGEEEFEERDGCLLLYDRPYNICHSTRTGILCGQCEDGLGVGMLTNICRPFVDLIAQAYWLVPIYLVLLVVLLVLIVRLGFHFPTILRGFLFYIQISSVAVAYLPTSFNLNIDIMDCAWSATALYVPYDFSFRAGMTSLESYGLRYSTLIVAVIVVPLAARIGRSHSKYWHGVWTIVLLLYARAVDTSVALLFCPTLNGILATGVPDSVTLWFFDGSVKCFQGAHLFLALVAMVVLVLLALLIPLTAAVIYHKKVRRKFPFIERFEGLSVAIGKGFKEKFKWWPIMELACRFVFITVVELSPGFTFVPQFLSLILLMMQMVVQPYTSKLANGFETFVLTVLVILLALGTTTPLTSGADLLHYFTLWPLFFLPLAVAGVVNVIRICFLIWKFCKSWKKKRFQKTNLNGERQRSRLEKFTSSIKSTKVIWGRATNVTSSIVGFEDYADADNDNSYRENGDTNAVINEANGTRLDTL